MLADDAPEKQQVTVELFDKYIQAGIYQTFISNLVITETDSTSEETKRERLLKYLEEYPLEMVKIEMSEEVEALAAAYVEQGIIPRNKQVDALHVAIAVVNEIDILLSWNYRHLANVHRERKIIGTNSLLGYIKNFRIITPLEVLDT